MPMLKAAPDLRPIAIFEEMLRRHPDCAKACAERWSAGSTSGVR